MNPIRNISTSLPLEAASAPLANAPKDTSFKDFLLQSPTFSLEYGLVRVGDSERHVHK